LVWGVVVRVIILLIGFLGFRVVFSVLSRKTCGFIQ